jgi:hypothetical protein
VITDRCVCVIQKLISDGINVPENTRLLRMDAGAHLIYQHAEYVPQLLGPIDVKPFQGRAVMVIESQPACAKVERD